MTSEKDDFDVEQPFIVPFVSQDDLEYNHGQERSAAAEALIEREFGGLGVLSISSKRVAVGEHTLIDLEREDIQDPDDLYTRPWQAGESVPARQSKIAAEFDRLVKEKPVKLENVFRLRTINGGQDLRIAVQSPLLHSQTDVIQQLLVELKKYPANNFEIDLNLCTEMSITGIGILLLMQQNIGADSEHVIIINGKPAIMQLLKWAGMDQYFTLRAA